MSLAELLKKNRVKQIPVDEGQVKKIMEVADRDLAVAEELLKINFDASFIHAYNSMLQAGRALMYSHGYRPEDEEGHKTTIEFVSAMLGEKHSSQLNTFDRMRRKRHIATYDEAGTVSEYQAKFALQAAKEFLPPIKAKIREKFGH